MSGTIDTTKYKYNNTKNVLNEKRKYLVGLSNLSLIPSLNVTKLTLGRQLSLALIVSGSGFT